MRCRMSQRCPEFRTSVDCHDSRGRKKVIRFSKPLFAVLRVEIFASYLQISSISLPRRQRSWRVLNGEVHERAALKADDLFDDVHFGFVEQAHDRGLIICNDSRYASEPVYILEQERMVATHWFGHFELAFGHTAERAFIAEKQRQKVRAARMLGNG